MKTVLKGPTDVIILRMSVYFPVINVKKFKFEYSDGITCFKVLTLYNQKDALHICKWFI